MAGEDYDSNSSVAVYDGGSYRQLNVDSIWNNKQSNFADYELLSNSSSQHSQTSSRKKKQSIKKDSTGVN